MVETNLTKELSTLRDVIISGLYQSIDVSSAYSRLLDVSIQHLEVVENLKSGDAIYPVLQETEYCIRVLLESCNCSDIENLLVCTAERLSSKHDNIIKRAILS